MRSKQLACLLALIGMSGVLAPPLSACGDKFLALGRSLSFHQAFASLHPGAIAIYTRNPTASAEALEPLRRLLTRAGHRVSIVGGTQPGTLAKPSGVDLVLASVIDSDAVRALVGTSQLQPTVLYVASGERAVARSGAASVKPVLKSDDKAEKFLRVVEDAMKDRTKAGIRVKQ